MKTKKTIFRPKEKRSSCRNSTKRKISILSQVNVSSTRSALSLSVSLSSNHHRHRHRHLHCRRINPFSLNPVRRICSPTNRDKETELWSTKLWRCPTDSVLASEMSPKSRSIGENRRETNRSDRTRFRVNPFGHVRFQSNIFLLNFLSPIFDESNEKRTRRGWSGRCFVSRRKMSMKRGENPALVQRFHHRWGEIRRHFLQGEDETRNRDGS